MGFPTLEDFELRDRIAAAFKSARREGGLILTSPVDAETLAGIAVTVFRKELRVTPTIPLVSIKQEG